MGEDHVARILRMLEEGKISAAEAQSLLAAVKTDAREERAQTGSSQTASQTGARTTETGPKTFDFRWSQRRGFPVDFAAIGRQISAAVGRIDPEKIVKEARIGERLRDFARMWQDDEPARPVNPSGLPTVRRTQTVPLTIAPDGSLHVENRYGDIAIIGGTETASMEISREAWASTEVEAEIRIGELDVKVDSPDAGEAEDTKAESETGTPSTSDVRIHVAVPTGWRDGVVNLTLRVPGSVKATTATLFGVTRITGVNGALEARTSSGDIILDRLGGPVMCETVSGAVRASGIGERFEAVSKSGEVEAERLAVGGTVVTVSGDIRVHYVETGQLETRSVSGDIVVEHLGTRGEAELRVETVSGDARLSEIVGSLDLKTVSGDIAGEHLTTGRVTAQAVSGDLSLAFADAFDGSAKAETVSGDVTLATPEGSSCRFELMSRSGDLVCEHPSPDASRSETSLVGTIGAGKGSIVVHTLSGDVHITRIP